MKNKTAQISALLFLLLFNFISSAQQDNAKYVDPFIGTAAHGHVYPGATVPFGMVQLSPDNGRGGWDWCSGYNYSDSLIAGFSHTHLSGTGIGDLYDILFTPAQLPDAPESDFGRIKFQSRFDHKNEKAVPGYYSVYLDDYNVKTELTAALRSGFHRYTFKNTRKACVVIDLGFALNWDTPVDTYIKIENDSTISGYRKSKGWANDQRVYFTAVFSKPIRHSFLFADSVQVINADEVKAKRTRAVVQVDFGNSSELLVKVSISSADIEGAKNNLAGDIRDWNFERVKKSAYDLWKTELGKISIESGNENLKKTFYTSLYRTMLAPVVFSDADGRYKGADGNIHKAEGYTKYSIFSLWDTFRAEHPMFTILRPDIINDLVNSMLSHYREYGLLPVWELLGNETNTMIGYHAIPVIADAILKGFNGFDINEAYAAMKKSAMQDKFGLKDYREYKYIPADKENESVSKTLEYAYDDWCIAQIAKFLGKDNDYKLFSERSGYYKNLFDPSVRFMRGKMSDGTWKTPFSPKFSNHRDDSYTEGNAWQYTWFVPQDVYGLINLMGGNEKFTEKLDSLFSIDSKIEGTAASPDISGLIGQYAHGNEPSHHIAYLYNYAGQPWKTQQRVHEILTTLYNDTPAGLCGNEDCGQMSAWYVLSSIGFYPVNPAQQVYVIGTPLFDRTEINLESGKKFVVEAKNLSADNFYIQSAELNGKPLNRSYLYHSEIMDGGKLVFNMGPQPNKKWCADNISAPTAQPEVNKKFYAEKVRRAFIHAWDGYKKYAWGHDDLKPLTKSFRDWYKEPLLMTPVDAFDTMILMGLKEQAAEAKNLILEKLSFDKDISVQNFEITIRLLGGLISAYQLDGDKRFLKLAEDLGNRLLPVFNSPTGMPYVNVNLKTGAVSGKINNPAEIGTLILEFGSLSKLTGNQVYYEKAKRGVVEVYKRRSRIGLVGTTIDVETGEWKNTDSHISGMIDSYYEYLLKASILFGDKEFRKMYDESMNAVNKYLADSVTTGFWYGRADMNTGKITGTTFGSLDAFLPAVLALGGDLKKAENLQESAFKMWNLYGIEPEELNYRDMSLTAPNYELRPEIMESAYYLYSYTHNPRYLDMGVDFINGIDKYCRNENGYASLKNVVSKEQKDQMHSFFLAETLKYLYLLFTDKPDIDFGKTVFNTEAHPINITWKNN